MIEIRLTTFVDFVISSGTPRITQIRKAKAQYEEEYSPATDFYKKVREGIIRMHEEGLPKTYLDSILHNISNKKHNLYDKCIQSYKRWMGRKEFLWNGKVSSTWSSGDLNVIINPEFSLRINGNIYVIKLYFKSEPLSKRRIETILHLIRINLPRNYRNTIVAIMDVQNGKLIEESTEIPDIDALLHGEAAAFVDMWNRVE